MRAKTSPSLSVIVPTYRRPHLLRTCLNSLQQQTWRDFEVLVCDNADDPSTAELVRQLCDERFVYYPRETNLGILGNVIVGFQDSSAELVMELDDDDYLEPDALRLLLEPFQEFPDLTMSFGDLEIVDERGRIATPEQRARKIQKNRRLREGLYPDYSLLAAQGFIFTVAAVIRRNAVDWSTIPEEAATSYDRYITVEASRQGGPAYYVDQRIAFYRVHDGMDTVKSFEGQADGAMFVLRHALEGAGTDEKQALLREMTNLRFEKARHQARHRRKVASAVSFTRAILAPYGPTYAKSALQSLWPRLRSLHNSPDPAPAATTGT